MNPLLLQVDGLLPCPPPIRHVADDLMVLREAVLAALVVLPRYRAAALHPDKLRARAAWILLKPPVLLVRLHIQHIQLLRVGVSKRRFDDILEACWGLR